VGLKRRGKREKGEKGKKPEPFLVPGFAGEAYGNNSAEDFG
jgi:hypothetical protein